MSRRRSNIRDWREITAKYTAPSTSCTGKDGAAHHITAGESIGYMGPRVRGERGKTICAACWRAWVAENAQAAAAEAENFWYR